MESIQELVTRYGLLGWRRRWWAVLAAWVVCIGGWIGVASLPNQYEASTRVYIDADAVLTPLLRGITVDSSLTDEIDLLQQMMLSRPNIEKIIAKTDLQLDATTRPDLDRLVEKLSRSIKLTPVSRNIFTITYRNRDRQLAYDVVQAVLASFIEDKTINNREEMEHASEFLDSQIDSYEKQVRAAESKRADFRRKYVDLLPGDNGVNRLEQAREEVRTLTGQLADAKVSRILLARELAGTPQVVATDSAVAGDNASLRAAESHLRQLQQIYTDEYPEVISAKHEVDALRHAGGGGSGATPSIGGRSAPNPLYEQLKLRVVETDAQINSLQRQVDDAIHERDRLDSIARGAPGLEAQYLNLNRDYDVLRKNYDELLSRREGMRISTKAQASSSNVKMVIIDPPQVPQAPVAPARVMLSIGVLVLGLAAGVAAVVAIVTLDTSFHSLVQLRTLGLPVIGGVSLAALPPTMGERLRNLAAFGGAVAALLIALGGVLLHYTLQT
jgi:polysaccharide chain length determinant protein (PEP-CTERM system associated)